MLLVVIVQYFMLNETGVDNMWELEFPCEFHTHNSCSVSFEFLIRGSKAKGKS